MTRELTAEQENQRREIIDITRRGAEMGGWTNNVALVVHSMYAKGTNQAEFMAFAHICRTTGLDPLNKEIYCIVYNKDDRKKRQMVVVTAVVGLRKIGMQTGEVTQLDESIFLDGEGEWHDVWTSAENPVAARFGIARVGMIKPRTVTVTWQEFAKDPTSKEGKFWREMPAWMLGKVAESQCWRAVFPAQMQQLHDESEVGDGLPPPDVIVDAIDVEATTPPQIQEPEAFEGVSNASGGGTGGGDSVEYEPGDRSGDRLGQEPDPPAQMQMNTKLIIGTLEVAMQAMKVDHDAIGAVTGASEDDDVAAWLLEQMGEERTIPALNSAIAELCTMAADA